MKTVAQAQIAYDAAERLFTKAAHRAATLETKLATRRVELLEAMAAARPYTADDYRIVMTPDGRDWSTKEQMLDDVFGDCWQDEDGQVSELAQQYIDAFNDKYSGVYCWHASLEILDRVTGEYEDVDGCGGFYSLTQCVAEDDVLDQLAPADLANAKDIEFVY